VSSVEYEKPVLMPGGHLMLHYNPLHCFPSSEELPDSDDTPVDNELQDLIPGLLKLILSQIWGDRQDWFFGVDMGIYYDPYPIEPPVIVPDGFLSLGVQRIIDEGLRLSYVLWEENGIVPLFVLEVVSKKYGGEYSKKKEKYRELGVLYYAVYSIYRRRKPPLELYKLIDDTYVLQPGLQAGKPYWMPEVGLGIGRERGVHMGIEREWLYWYDAENNRCRSPEELVVQAEARADQAEAQANQAQQSLDALLEKLRSQGINPDNL
jgi:Uma2 family endonuclease